MSSAAIRPHAHVSSAEERLTEADPREPYGKANSTRAARQPLGYASLEAFEGPGSQRKGACHRSQLLSCKSPGIGALPLEGDVTPKRRKTKFKRNNQSEKPKNDWRRSQFAECNADMVRSGTEKGKSKREREPKVSYPNHKRGQTARAGEGESASLEVLGNRCERVPRKVCSPPTRSAWSGVHFFADSPSRQGSLGCACSHLQKPPPDTVQCSVPRMSRAGRPKWQQRLGRLHPRAFVITGA